MKIAVDFDGTIVEDRYPEIGQERMFAFETLKHLQSQGHTLILWSCRTGKYLDEAVEFCKKNGIEFYAVNANYPGEERIQNAHDASEWEGVMRKIEADIYIDDRNVGGLPEWGEIAQKLSPTENLYEEKKKKQKKTFMNLFK